MSNFHAFALVLVYHLTGLLSFSAVLINAISYKRNKSQVVKACFYTSLLIFLMVIWMYVGGHATQLGLRWKEPVQSLSTLLQTLVNVAATLIPPIYVYSYFQKNIPLWFKLLNGFLTGFIVSTHAQFAFGLIPFDYFAIWGQSPSYISYAITIGSAIVFYPKEESVARKKFFKKMILFTALTYPIYILDGYVWQRWWTSVLWVVRPVFYMGISILLIELRFKIPTLFPDQVQVQDDYQHFISSNRLTQREGEVFELVIKGCRNKEVANHLGVKEKSVENHLTKIYRKCDVTSRQELLRKALLANQ